MVHDIAVFQEYGHLCRNMRRNESFEVRIDRATKWGNPIRLKIDTPEERIKVLWMYYQCLHDAVRGGTFSIQELAQLSGKTLGCWCAPKLCHGMVLAYAAERCAESLRK